MQIKPDMLVAWPTTLDYPAFRIHLKEYRHLFEKIIILWSNHNAYMRFAGKNIKFIEKELSELKVEFQSYREADAQPDKDWANRLYRAGFKKSTSRYVLLTQQDFIVNNKSFYDTVLTDQYSMISHFSNGCNLSNNEFTRFEPDFILIDNSILKQTSMDVSIGVHPIAGIGLDHCGVLSHEIKKICSDIKTLEEFNLFCPKDWEHLSGLTQNYSYVIKNDFSSITQPERFIKYNKDLLKVIKEVNVLPETMQLIINSANFSTLKEVFNESSC